MAVFARPTSDEFAPYFKTYLDFPTSAKDALKHLKTQGLDVLHLLRSLDDEAADYRYAPDKWSIKEMVGHGYDNDKADKYCSQESYSNPVPFSVFFFMW